MYVSNVIYVYMYVCMYGTNATTATTTTTTTTTTPSLTTTATTTTTDDVLLHARHGHDMRCDMRMHCCHCRTSNNRAFLEQLFVACAA